jgi:hypothetical protein
MPLTDIYCLYSVNAAVYLFMYEYFTSDVALLNEDSTFQAASSSLETFPTGIINL